MSTYEPKWRRPIAGVFRRSAGPAVRWCVAHDVHPNTVSYSSIVASAAGALCFWQAGTWPILLIPAVGFCYLRLWFNMLDGMVALASGKASATGEIANELPDRISDVAIFVGVAHSGLCQPFLGYWAALAALFVAYVGTLGQAVGVQREFSGIMAKPWRMVVLHLGSWLMLGFLWAGADEAHLYGHTILDWALYAILAGCLETVVVRLVRIVRALHRKHGTTRTPGIDREISVADTPGQGY